MKGKEEARNKRGESRLMKVDEREGRWRSGCRWRVMWRYKDAEGGLKVKDGLTHEGQGKRGGSEREGGKEGGQ